MRVENKDQQLLAAHRGAHPCESRILYDEEATAKLLGVSRRWLQAARQTGNGPAFIKVGRLVRYRPQDIDLFLEGQRRSSTSEGA